MRSIRSAFAAVVAALAILLGPLVGAAPAQAVTENQITASLSKGPCAFATLKSVEARCSIPDVIIQRDDYYDKLLNKWSLPATDLVGLLEDRLYSDKQIVAKELKKLTKKYGSEKQLKAKSATQAKALTAAKKAVTTAEASLKKAKSSKSKSTAMTKVNKAVKARKAAQSRLNATKAILAKFAKQHRVLSTERKQLATAKRNAPRYAKGVKEIQRRLAILDKFLSTQW